MRINWLDDNTDERKVRLKTATRQMDWPALIGQIMEDMNCTADDIAKVIGMPASKLRAIKAESIPFTPGDQALRLLSVFLMNTERDIPILGEDNEMGKTRAVKKSG